jgi:hypothetical protein
MFDTYKDSYESDVFLRVTERKDNMYTGFLEALGSSVAEGISEPSFLHKSFFSFTNARSTGFYNPALVHLEDFSFVSFYFQFAFPWNPNLFDKSRARIQRGEQGNILAITLSPRKSDLKEIRRLDNRFGFGSNTPPFFTNLIRTYFIDLNTDNILSIDLHSISPSSAEFDQVGRKYNNRKYHYTLNYPMPDRCFISYAKEDLIYSTPNLSSPLHSTIEIFYTGQVVKKLNDDELAARYSVYLGADLSEWEGGIVHRRQNYKAGSVSKRFGRLMYNEEKYSFKKEAFSAVPIFADKAKMLSDQKDNRFINEFLDN